MRLTDVRPIGAMLYLLPVRTRIPLKFGPETLTQVTCGRACIVVQGRDGRIACGWGETPLSVQWAWPGELTYAERHERLIALAASVARDYAALDIWGHPMEIGHAFVEHRLSALLAEQNITRGGAAAMPRLAALVCCSAFDLALHDAFGMLHGVPIYDTYGPDWMSRSLSAYLEADGWRGGAFEQRYPKDAIVRPRPNRLLAWHLVGGLDPLAQSDLTGGEPDDGYPLLLPDWIVRDGLQCLKVKLRGNDSAWDYDRLLRVGEIARENGVRWLSADFNCTVEDPAYVNEILDRLRVDAGAIFDMLLYVEQPFPYDLEARPIDVHSVSTRKPLFLDESAHDWRLIRLGQALGWTGVALKTCKTQTGAILSLCWAKIHGLDIMVQDLTNPMLAQIPHALLAAHAGTIMGIETNAMQFYPEASTCEQKVHPGLYVRRQGCIDLSSVRGPGFGYRLDEMSRPMPEPVCAFGSI